jgi:hypothetical protein
MSCFCHRFPHVGYNRIPSGPSYTLRPYRYSHTSSAHPTRQLTRAFLISQQVIPYWTCGGTCCLGVSTRKIQFLADSNTTCHDEINHLHPSNHCSNHNIDLDRGHHHERRKIKHSIKDTSQTQHHTKWMTCMTTKLMTTRLSNYTTINPIL